MYGESDTELIYEIEMVMGERRKEQFNEAMRSAYLGKNKEFDALSRRDALAFDRDSDHVRCVTICVFNY